jgi:hypothetical protein
LKPGTDLTVVADVLKTFEQSGSGLVRELFMRDQKDPNVGYVLTVFESEEKAREQDPRRAQGQQATNELMAKMLCGPTRVHRHDSHRGMDAVTLRRSAEQRNTWFALGTGIGRVTVTANELTNRRTPSRRGCGPSRMRCRRPARPG